jgi:protein-tyrosine-phosphatase
MRTPITDRVYNVLFLCTGNSARSIMAESILNKDGRGRFRAFSACSQPKGKVNPYALKVLATFGCPAESARSKGWDVHSPDAVAPLRQMPAAATDDRTAVPLATNQIGIGED